jgi:hypothetical protein
MKPTDLIAKYGSAAKAANALGMHRRTVHHWLKAKAIPYRTQRWIEFETKGTLKAAKK